MFIHQRLVKNKLYIYRWVSQVFVYTCLFMYPVNTLHLVARRYHIVPAQGGVSFPLECGYLALCYYLQVLCQIKAQQYQPTSTLVQHLSDYSSTVKVSTVVVQCVRMTCCDTQFHDTI